MRIFLKFTIFTILSVVFLLPAYVSAQDVVTGSGSARDKKTTTDTTKKTESLPKTSGNTKADPDDSADIIFPEIDGWDKGSKRTYPTRELGYSLAYQSEEGGVVTIYVYNRGLNTIPTDVNDKVIKSEIENAKNEIIQVGKMGVYEDVKEVKNDSLILGGIDGKTKALRSLFTFKIKGTLVDSEIYLFSYKNNFIKIRSTRPKSDTENKAIVDFLKEIDKIFSK